MGDNWIEEESIIIFLFLISLEFKKCATDKRIASLKNENKSENFVLVSLFLPTSN